MKIKNSQTSPLYDLQSQIATTTDALEIQDHISIEGEGVVHQFETAAHQEAIQGLLGQQAPVPTLPATPTPPATSTFPEPSAEGTFLQYSDFSTPEGWTALDYQNWEPDNVADKGSLTRKDGKFSVSGLDNLSSDQLGMVKQAMVDLWDNTFMYRFADGSIGENGTVLLGDDEAGAFEFGTFTNPIDHQTYQILRWDDIDDNSYTLFFQKNDQGQMTLKASQYDN